MPGYYHSNTVYHCLIRCGIFNIIVYCYSSKDRIIKAKKTTKLEVTNYCFSVVQYVSFTSYRSVYTTV
jgi:hypothetical protein